MNDTKRCGSCEYHEDFVGTCFCWKSEKRADFTCDDECCDSFEPRKKAHCREYNQLQKRNERAVTRPPIKSYDWSCTCGTCALFQRDYDTRAGGYCPIPKRRGFRFLSTEKKYVTQCRKACSYYSKKEVNEG